MSGPEALKLRAANAEDLSVFSAFLQDAVVPVADMTFLAADERFALVANRFRWEQAGEPVDGRIFERVHAGICFEKVTAVRQRGLDNSVKGQILSLLTIEYGDGHIDLLFSAGVSIRLEVSRIMCHFQDLDEPWPTQWRPAHAIADD